MTNLTLKNNEKMFILCIALLQGTALLLIWLWVKNLAVARQYFDVILPLYVLAFSLPLSLMLLAQQPRKLAFYMSTGFSLIAAFCAMYFGDVSYVNGLPTYANDGWTFQFGFSMVVAWFIAITLIEHYCQYGTWSTHYASLYDFSWRNAVKLITASIFTGLFWLALLLLAGLFKVLGITFFELLIENIYFNYPATAVAFGLGISLYSAKQDALSEFKRAILQVLGWLLPLVSLILIGFIATLPVMGVDLLWKNGYDTGLITMFSLLSLVVFLINCAFQDGRQLAYPSWYANLTNFAILTMPLYALLCAYGISMRISQLGWTDERVWAVVAIFVISLYAFGYAFAALKSFNLHKTSWIQGIKSINVITAICVISVIALIYSPILSPIRIGVQSQLARLNDGKVAADKFDYEYLRFSGGQYGDAALKGLLADTSNPQAATIKPLVEAALKNQYRTNHDYLNEENPEKHIANANELRAFTNVHPKTAQVESSFFDALFLEYQSNQIYFACLPTAAKVQTEGCHILAVDLDHDQQNELIVLNEYDGRVYSKDSKGWHFATTIHLECCESQKAESLETLTQAFKQALADEKISVTEPKWRNLKIGDKTYKVSQ